MMDLYISVDMTFRVIVIGIECQWVGKGTASVV
jgi:hypothetical protein